MNEKDIPRLARRHSSSEEPKRRDNPTIRKAHLIDEAKKRLVVAEEDKKRMMVVEEDKGSLNVADGDEGGLFNFFFLLSSLFPSLTSHHHFLLN